MSDLLVLPVHKGLYAVEGHLFWFALNLLPPSHIDTHKHTDTKKLMQCGAHTVNKQQVFSIFYPSRAAVTLRINTYLKVMHSLTKHARMPL